MAHPWWSPIRFKILHTLLDFSGQEVCNVYTSRRVTTAACKHVTTFDLFFFFCSFFSILQCLKRGRMHPGARRPVPAPSAWDIRLVSALRLCWRGSQPPQEGEYIYIERDHYRTMAFRRYGHFYTHRSPAQTLLRWEDVPHAGDTRFLPTVFLLVLWGRNERKSTCCLANLLAKVSTTENSL